VKKLPIHAPSIQKGADVDELKEYKLF